MDAENIHYPRALERSLREALADTPVVCLLGPRQCGKTTLAKSVEKDRAYITLDEASYHRTATEDPDGFVDRLPGRVTLDEVQRAPGLLPAIKQSVDRDLRPGRFLLRGSANLLLLPGVSESLAGRMEIMPLQPLTESEKEFHVGDFLRTFLDGSLHSSVMLGEDNNFSPDLPLRLVAGGYPEPLTRSPVRARQWHRQYLNSIIERDVQDIARVKNGQELGRLLEMLALRTASLLNVNSLSKVSRRKLMGHLLESFVVQQIHAQAA